MTRNPAIDILKFMAVLFIFNAHSVILYPVCSWMSTGGYIGDALFFFCSGFTLFRGRGRELGRFDSWYKRRLSRIWPSCMAFALMSYFFSARPLTVYETLCGVGWFVKYILVVYIVMWCLGKLFINKMKWVFFISIAGSLFFCWVYLWTGDSNPNHWKWSFFFPVVILGALVGINEDRIKTTPLIDVCACFAAFALFTFVIAAGTRMGLRYVQLFGLPLILVFAYYAYKTATVRWIYALPTTSKGKIICWVGGLCLDFYLIKWTFISDALNSLFPLNLPIMLIYLLFIAYLNRMIGRIIQQTFVSKKEPYDWKAIVAL